MAKSEVKLNVWIPDDMHDRILKIADQRNMSKAEATRTVIDLGLEVHRDLSRIGVVRLADMIYNLKTALKNIPEDEVEGLKT